MAVVVSAQSGGEERRRESIPIYTKNGEEEEERRKEAREVKMARHCVEYGGVKLITQGDGNPRRWLSAPHHMNVLVSNERNGTGTAL